MRRTNSPSQGYDDFSVAVSVGEPAFAGIPRTASSTSAGYQFSMDELNSMSKDNFDAASLLFTNEPDAANIVEDLGDDIFMTEYLSDIGQMNTDYSASSVINVADQCSGSFAQVLGTNSNISEPNSVPNILSQIPKQPRTMSKELLSSEKDRSSKLECVPLLADHLCVYS